LAAISLQRLKVARIDDVNDPFELQAMNCMRKDVRKAIADFRASQNEKIGLLCFSQAWKNPVLWSHYADRHRGICLGFDIDRTLAARGESPAGIRPAMHPRWLRCSSITYAQYSQSSRLASGAPRRPRCCAGTFTTGC
jgi:hypothetical protein